MSINDNTISLPDDATYTGKRIAAPGRHVPADPTNLPAADTPTDPVTVHDHTFRLVDANGDDLLTPLRRVMERIELLLTEIRDQQVDRQ